jgi:hypothetical protein
MVIVNDLTKRHFFVEVRDIKTEEDSHKIEQVVRATTLPDTFTTSGTGRFFFKPFNVTLSLIPKSEEVDIEGLCLLAAEIDSRLIATYPDVKVRCGEIKLKE